MEVEVHVYHKPASYKPYSLEIALLMIAEIAPPVCVYVCACVTVYNPINAGLPCWRDLTYPSRCKQAVWTSSPTCAQTYWTAFF